MKINKANGPYIAMIIALTFIIGIFLADGFITVEVLKDFCHNPIDFIINWVGGLFANITNI